MTPLAGEPDENTHSDRNGKHDQGTVLDLIRQAP